MDNLLELLSSHGEHLLGRTAGPLNFRLLVMPLVTTFFAVRAAMRDAREGQPRFFQTFVTHPGDRARLFRSAMKDAGKILVMAIVLDTTYQILVSEIFLPRATGFCSFGIRHPAVSGGPQRDLPAHAPDLPGPSESSKLRLNIKSSHACETDHRPLITDH